MRRLLVNRERDRFVQFADDLSTGYESCDHTQGGYGVAFNTMISYARSIKKLHSGDTAGTSPSSVQVMLTYYYSIGIGDILIY